MLSRRDPRLPVGLPHNSWTDGRSLMYKCDDKAAGYLVFSSRKNDAKPSPLQKLHVFPPRGLQIRVIIILALLLAIFVCRISQKYQVLQLQQSNVGVLLSLELR